MVKPLKWNSTAPARQRIYLKALRVFIPEIEIKLGNFLITEKYMHVSEDCEAKKSLPRKMLVPRIEEKASDVNLAVAFANDAWKNSFECHNR
jgi:hypothetical protein